MALSSKIKDKELMVLDGFKFEMLKTKAGAGIIKALSSKMDGYRASKKKMDSILLVTDGQDKTTARVFNNLSFVDMLSAGSLNIKDVLSKKYLVLLQDAVPVIEKTYRI
jgi:large subunit ribosomal protein L4